MALSDVVIEAIVDCDQWRDRWTHAICGWAHSQRSRRIVLRCAQHEQAAINILLEADNGKAKH